MEDDVEHGPDQASYYNTFTDRGYMPSMTCLCGWETDRSAVCWEDVGWQFDEHLEEAAVGKKEESDEK